MQPDWDMFQSKHPAAHAHAAARAVSGAAVYVSDYPGQHDFGLLKKLVLPDGSVLRASLPGRPTADCLFTDVLRDGKSLLKVCHLLVLLGLAVRCQGAWCADKGMFRGSRCNLDVERECMSSWETCRRAPTSQQSHTVGMNLLGVKTMSCRLAQMPSLRPWLRRCGTQTHAMQSWAHSTCKALLGTARSASTPPTQPIRPRSAPRSGSRTSLSSHRSPAW